jgi:hypothetical protein
VLEDYIGMAMTTKPQSMSPARSAASVSTGNRKIIRDMTFVRATADEIMPLVLGRDIELCCLLVSPVLKGMIDKGDHYVPELDDARAEVARIRIGYGEAVELAMTILAQGITGGRVKGSAVVNSIEEWIAEFEADEAGRVEHES